MLTVSRKKESRRKITALTREKWNRIFITLEDNLSIWLTPDSFNKQVSKILESNRLPSYVFFNLPAAQIAMDAWIIGTYARLANADKVRLSGDRWPDGMVRFGERTVNVEATEVQEPGRRRGEAYRRMGSVSLDPVENWHKRADAIGPQLTAAIQAKNAKRYGTSSDLVIYVNLATYGLRQLEIEEIIRDRQQRLKGGFDAVHVIWSGNLYLGVQR